eukprot:GHVL01003126.1.p1 GENE.GHVL01003126.1~~GHVL01003126.1.p1  ORF type:complete len:143 (+),score=39.60 GHVL01003126.1:28-429(+)
MMSKLERDSISKLNNLIKQCKKHTAFSHFINPVESADPICLNTIKAKLDERIYTSTFEFFADFVKMFKNCRILNSGEEWVKIIEDCEELLEKEKKNAGFDETVEKSTSKRHSKSSKRSKIKTDQTSVTPTKRN